MRRDRFLAEKQQRESPNHVTVAAKVKEDELRRQIGELAGNEAGDVPEWDEELGMLVATVLFLKGPAGTEEVSKMGLMQWEHVLLSGYVQESAELQIVPVYGAEVVMDQVQEYLGRVLVEVLRQSTSAPEEEREKSEQLGRVLSDEIQKMQNDSDWSLKARVQWTAMVESLQLAHDKCCPGSFRACSKDESGHPVLTLLRGALHEGVSEFARSEALDPELKKKFVRAPFPPPRTSGDSSFPWVMREQERKNEVRDLLYAEATRSLPGRPPCSTPTDTATLVTKIVELTGAMTDMVSFRPMWADEELWKRARKDVGRALSGVGLEEAMDFRSPSPSEWLENAIGDRIGDRKKCVRGVQQLVVEAAVAAQWMFHIRRGPPARESFPDMEDALRTHAREHPDFSEERAQEVLRSYVNQKMQGLEPFLKKMQELESPRKNQVTYVDISGE
jgi:hypothetical protein